MSSDSSNDDNLIKKVRKMPTANILTFEEFIKSALGDYSNRQLLNPENNEENHFEMRLKQKNRAYRSERQLVMLSPNLRRHQGQGSARSLGHSSRSQFGVLESSRHTLSRSKSGQLVVNQYVIRDQVLGRGAFAEVRLCENVKLGKLYAVKILDQHRYRRARFSKIEEDVSHIMNKQVAIFKKLMHPNIVKLYEVIEDQEYKKLYMIMEYCEKGCLKTAMRKHVAKHNRQMNQKEIKVMIKGLLLALDYLHNQVGIAHCDIKPENVLLNEDGVVKLSDFGLSKEQYFQSAPTSSGTLVYMAPEVINGSKGVDIKVRDVWSLGITLFEVVTGRLPYPDAETTIQLQKVINNFSFNFDFQIMSQSLKVFLHRCLEKDPAQRATIKELMYSKWITEGDFQLKQKPEFLTKGFVVTPQDEIASIVKKKKTSKPVNAF